MGYLVGAGWVGARPKDVSGRLIPTSTRRTSEAADIGNGPCSYRWVKISRRDALFDEGDVQDSTPMAFVACLSG